MKVTLSALMLCTLASFPLYGAEDDPDNAPATSTTVATNDNTDDDTAADDSAQETDNTGLTAPPSDDDFVPSVRITEDLPVAFPVDI